MPSRALVVDANILVRAVLGRRVREVIETYAGEVSFFVPESAYAEAEEHLSELVIKHGGDPEKALALLRSLGPLMELIGSEARSLPQSALFVLVMDFQLERVACHGCNAEHQSCPPP